jgi:hypothetical protein
LFFLIGLIDEPVEEIPGIFSIFGQHFHGDHVEHLNGLVHFGVLILQINHPQRHITQNSQGHIEVSDNITKRYEAMGLGDKVVLPLLENYHDCRSNYIVMSFNDAVNLGNIVVDKVRCVSCDTASQLRIEDR